MSNQVRQFSYALKNFTWVSEGGELAVHYVLHCVVGYDRELNRDDDGHKYLTVANLVVESVQVVSLQFKRGDDVIDAIAAWEDSKLERWTKDFMKHGANDGSFDTILEAAKDQLTERMPTYRESRERGTPALVD